MCGPFNSSPSQFYCQQNIWMVKKYFKNQFKSFYLSKYDKCLCKCINTVELGGPELLT